VFFAEMGKEIGGIAGHGAAGTPRVAGFPRKKADCLKFVIFALNPV
jgi:hypothetical protein